MKLPLNVFALSLMLGVVNAQFPPCDICDDGETITDPDVILPQDFAFFLAEDMTCAQAQEMATDGGFNIIQCNLLSLAEIATTCGCGEASTPVTPAPVTDADPTDPPVPETDKPTAVPTKTPTEAPVSTEAPTTTPVEVTDAPVTVPPTEAPTQNPVSAPTSSPVSELEEPTQTPAQTSSPVSEMDEPTQTPIDGTAPTAAPAPMDVGSVYIRVIAVGDDPLEADSEAEDGFEAACTSLYETAFAESLTDVACIVRLHTLEAVGDIGNALNVVTLIIGKPVDGSMVPANFTEMLPNMFNENSEDFISLLQSEGTDESQDYFADATFAEAFDPDSEIPPPFLPEAAPTTVPGGPTAAPVVAPTVTEVPTASVEPTASSVAFNGTGVVYIRIQPVEAGPMSEASQEAFEEACTSFYGDQLEDVLEDVECTLRIYTVAAVVDEEERRKLRSLQTINALDIITEVSGTPVGETTWAAYEALLVSVMAENSDDFITTLQVSGDEEAQAYFANVAAAEAFVREGPPMETSTPTFSAAPSTSSAPTSSAVPTSSPVPVASTPRDTNDNGLSGGAIAGIVVAVIAGFLALFFFLRKRAPSVPQPAALDANNPSLVSTPDDASSKYAAVVVPTAGSIKSSKSQASGVASRASASTSYRQSAAPIKKVHSERMGGKPTAVATVVSVSSEPLPSNRSVVSERKITSEGSVANVRSLKDPSGLSVATAASAPASSVRFGSTTAAPDPSDDDSSTEDGVMM